VVASIPCGERFTILVYGFYFSRIQTKDGQVGYIYSSLISQDRGATSLQPAASKQPTGQQNPSLQAAAEKTKIPREAPFDAQPKSAEATQPQTAARQAASVPSAPVQAAPVVAAPTPTPVAEVAASAAAPASSTSSSNGAGTAAPAAQPTAGQTEIAQPAPAQKAAAPEPVFTAPPSAPPTPSPDAVEPGVAVTQPSSNAAVEAAPAPAAAEPAAPAAAQPPSAQPAAAQPVAPAVRPVETKETWEKPRPGARTAPLLELAGGYAFARMGGGGSWSNLNGAVGSFGWNAKSWLQVTADTSYSVVTSGNTKNVLFGNHYGPRFFYRSRNRWGITPFAEALVGGSALKTTVSGTGGYSASTGSALSYKVGGGIDMHPSRRWDIRLVDVDYYSTSFGTNVHQSNYWISTGVVLRLFGGAAE
jgi:hypothetical protein